ncbi:hypothetical protein DZS_32230 [Dickeya ananatis]
MTEKSSRSQLEYALILGSLAALGPLCTDLYLPALPQMATAFATSTSAIQLSLTAGLLGLGAGQLFFGPLSDKLGRRLPLLLSLVMLLLTSIWCALAQDIGQLLVARLLQGIAGAGGAVLSRAIARDLYIGHALTRFFLTADVDQRSGTHPLAGIRRTATGRHQLARYFCIAGSDCLLAADDECAAAQ